MSRPSGAARAAADDDVRPDDIQPEAEAEAEAPETVLVEHEGQTYELPAALQGALMRHADYTQKVQALACDRQALAEAAEAMTNHAQTLADHGAEVGRVSALGEQIKGLSGLNWPVLQQQNPAQAQALMHQLFQLRQAHEVAVAALKHRQDVKTFEQRRQQAMQLQHANAVVARDIDGWGPDRASQIARYALSQGISEPELNTLADPRLVKILHHACAGHQAQQQTSAAQRLIKTQTVRPAIQVGGTGGAPQDPNRMSTDDWMRHRRGQLRTKAK